MTKKKLSKNNSLDDFIVSSSSEELNDSDYDDEDDTSFIHKRRRSNSDVSTHKEILGLIVNRTNLPNKIDKLSSRIIELDKNNNKMEKSLVKINDKLENIKNYLTDKYVSLTDIIALKVPENNQLELIKLYYVMNESDSPEAYLSNYLDLYEKFNGYLTSSVTINLTDPTKEFIEKLRNSQIPNSYIDHIYLKIMLLSSCSSNEESYKLKEWINFVLNIPWDTLNTSSKFSPLPCNEISKIINDARENLNKEFYGYNMCKDEILRQIVNIKLGNHPQVLALCGPPGVGKTMFFTSLGKALNMPVKIIQSGCITDQSFFTGHSVAYIGAHSGSIVNAISESKTFKLIIVLDEIDKIADDKNGTISQLIHLLDNSQNKHFIDNYIGSNISMDISQIYFCCTLNDQDKLSPILKNRIKIISIPGYDIHEKICIVKDHILPKIIESTIFKNYVVDFKDKEIEYLIKNKTEREEGMRNIIRVLKELIEKLQLNYLYDPSNYKGDKLYITKQIIDKLL